MVYGVSLGPGNPDLITLKGRKALEGADKIYFPGSLFADGQRSSYALTILAHYKLDEQKLHGFYLKMSDRREQAEAIYKATALSVMQDVKDGLSVAIVSEGDLSTYSSFSYILDHLKQQGIDTELIPGITSFALAAAESQDPLCRLNEKVIILPRVKSEQQLIEAMGNCDTLILMKIRSVMDVVLAFVKGKALRVQYFERLGTSRQFITEDVAELTKRDIPYFSLIIIQKCA